jgi:hypothetical protein
MVVRLSALRTRHTLLPKIIIMFIFLVEAEKTLGPSVAGRIR